MSKEIKTTLYQVIITRQYTVYVSAKPNSRLEVEHTVAEDTDDYVFDASDEEFTDIDVFELDAATTERLERKNIKVKPCEWEEES